MVRYIARVIPITGYFRSLEIKQPLLYTKHFYARLTYKYTMCHSITWTVVERHATFHATTKVVWVTTLPFRDIERGGYIYGAGARDSSEWSWWLPHSLVQTFSTLADQLWLLLRTRVVLPLPARHIRPRTFAATHIRTNCGTFSGP